MSSRSNNSGLIYAPETVLGVTDVDSVNWKTFPLAGADGLNSENITTASTRVRGDRGGNGLIKTGETVAGSEPTEFQADQHDDLIASALMTPVGASMANASVRSSYSFERDFGDLTNKYIVYNGVRVNGMNLSVAIDQKADLSFDVVGLTSDDDNVASLVGAGTLAPVSTNAVMSIKDLGNVSVGGTTGYCLESLNLTTTNNMEAKRCAGSANGAAVDQLEGEFTVTGSMVLATTDATWALLTTKRDNTPIEVSFDLSDGTTTYTFTVHEAFINFPDPSGQGQNTSIMLNIDFTARQSESDSATLTIVKV